MQPSVAELPAREFHEQIADTDIFCGGGSVAAVSAAGAGATALMVMHLNVKRRRNANRRAELEQAIERTKAAIEEFYAAADEDIAILQQLLEAQQSSKASGDPTNYRAALLAAAQSPLRMADSIAELLDLIASQLSISTRFTVSDLGAAAAMAEGACRAALLTAEVNIALLGEMEDADTALVSQLADRLEAVLERVVNQARAIESTTRGMMTGSKTTGGKR